MKTIVTTALIFVAFIARSQGNFPKEVRNKYEPNRVQEIIYEMINDSLGKSEIRKSVTFENYKYTYSIRQFQPLNADSVLVTWELIKKEKLFYRPYTALGVEAFAVGMGSMIFFSSIDLPKDKKFHALAGFYIGGTVSTFVYYKTGKKWIAVIVGTIVSSGVGLAKEFIDKYDGGVCSNLDAKYTIGGGVASAFTVRITLR